MIDRMVISPLNCKYFNFLMNPGRSLNCDCFQDREAISDTTVLPEVVVVLDYCFISVAREDRKPGVEQLNISLSFQRI